MPNELEAALSHFTPDAKALADARQRRVKKTSSYEQGYREGEKLRQEQARAAEDQLKEQARIDKERAKAEADRADLERKQRLAETEATYRRAGRPTFTDALGEIRPVDDDETWQRKQAEKKVAEDLKAQSRADAAFRKSEAVRLNQAETKLKGGLDDFDTAEAIGSQAVSAKASEIITLSQAHKAASDDTLPPAQRTQITSTPDYKQWLAGQPPESKDNPFAIGDYLATRIQSARKEKEMLENSERTIKVAKLNKEQELKPALGEIQQKRDVLPITTAPAIPKGAGVTLQNTVATATPTPASADPERAAAVLRTQITVLREKGDFTRADALERRLVNPAKWEAEQKAFRQSAAPEVLAQTIAAGSAEIEQQWQTTQQTYAALSTERQAYLDRMERAAAKNESLLNQPYSDGDVAIIRDETTGEETRWHKAAAEEYNGALQGLNGWQQANQEKIDLLDLNRQQLQIEAQNLQKHENQLRYLGREQQRQQDGENSAKLNALRQIPGMAEFADETERRGTEFKQRQTEIARKYTDPNLRRIAEQALQEDAAKADADMQERKQAKEQNITTLYTDWAKDLNVTDWQNDQDFTPRLQQEAKSRGLTEPEARKFLDTSRKLDWSRPLPDDAKGSRKLPDGQISVSPSLYLEPEGYQKAVDATEASPEAKKAALAQRRDLAAPMAAEMLLDLQKVPEFAEYLAKKTSGTPVERMEQFQSDLREGGALAASLQRFQGGASSLASSALGAVAGITGNDYVRKQAERFQQRAQAFETAGAEGAKGTNAVLGFGSKVIGAAPSMLGAMVPGGLLARLGHAAKLGSVAINRLALTGASLGSGAQSFGGTYLDAVQAFEKQGMSATEAHGKALSAALLSGSVTTALTALSGLRGAESLLAQKELVKKTLIERAKEIGIGIADEALEEGVDQLAQGIIAQQTYNPSKKIGDILSESLEAALIGGVLGGGMTALSETADHFANKGALLAEDLAAAESEIENYEDATLDQTENDHRRNRATLALAIARGVGIDGIDEVILNSAGWTRKNPDGITRADGSLTKIKGYESQNVLDVDSDGRVKLDAAYAKNLGVKNGMPTLAGLIGSKQTTWHKPGQIEEAKPSASPLPQVPSSPPPSSISPDPAKPAPSAKPSSGEVGPRTPAGTSQTRGTSAQGAAAVTDLDTAGKTQAAAPAVSGAAAAPSVKTVKEVAPDSKEALLPYLPLNKTVDAPRVQRAWEIANHLEMAGLDRASANLIATSEVRARGVSAGGVNGQVTSVPFNEMLNDLGMTGDRTTREGSEPLQLPADGLAKLRSKAASQSTASQNQAKPTTEESSTVAANQKPETRNKKPAPVAPNNPAYPALRAQLAAKEISTVDVLREVVRLSGKHDTGDLQDILTDHLGMKKIAAAAVVETLRAKGELTGAKNDNISLAAGKKASDRQSKPSKEGYTAAKEFVPATQGALAENPAWARAKLAMLARTPPARRRWAYRFLTHLENTISQRAGLYDAFAVGQTARQMLEGQKMAVVPHKDQITLAIDLDRMLADFSYLGDPRAAAIATVMEEDIHAAQFRLMAKGGKWTHASLAQQWRDLPAAIQQAVWKSYHNAHPDKTLPAKPDDATAFHMQSEFLRMLVQGRIDPKSITEAVDASPSLIQSIKDLLADLYDTLRSLIKGLPVSQAVTLDQQVTELKTALEQLGKPSTAEELRTKLFLRDPSALAMQALKNGTIFDHLATQDALFTPQGLARVWDLLTPEMRAQVLRLKKTASPWLSKKRTDNAGLTRDLLTFLLDPRAAEALAQANLTASPTATTSTSMVRRALRAMSDYFRSNRPDFAQTLGSLDLPTAQVLQQMQSLLVNARAQFEAAAAVQKLPALIIAEPQAGDEDTDGPAARSAKAMLAAWMQEAQEKAFLDQAVQLADQILPGVGNALQQRAIARQMAGQTWESLKARMEAAASGSPLPLFPSSPAPAPVLSLPSPAQRSAQAIEEALTDRDNQAQQNTSPQAREAIARRLMQEQWAAAILATAAQAERRYYLNQRELSPEQIRQIDAMQKVATGDLRLDHPYFQREISTATESGAPVRLMGVSRENDLKALGIRIGSDGTPYAAANAPVYIEGGTIIIKQSTLDDLSQMLPITRRQFRLSEDEQRARVGLTGIPQPVTAEAVAQVRAEQQQAEDDYKARLRLRQLEGQERAAETTSSKPDPLIDPNADPVTGKLQRGERGDLISWLSDHGSLGWPDTKAGGEWDWFLTNLEEYYSTDDKPRTRRKAQRDAAGNVIGFKDITSQNSKLGITNTAKKMARDGNLSTPAAIVEYLILHGVVTPAVPSKDGSPRNLDLHENLGDRTGLDSIEDQAHADAYEVTDGIGNAVLEALTAREAARSNRQNDPARAAEIQTLRFERDTRNGPAVVPVHELAPLSDDGTTVIHAQNKEGDIVPLTVVSYDWRPVDPDSVEADDFLDGHPAWRETQDGPERLVVTVRNGTYYGQQQIAGDTLLRVHDTGNTGLGVDLGDGKSDFVTDEAAEDLETGRQGDNETQTSDLSQSPALPAPSLPVSDEVSTNPELEAEIYAELRKAGLLAASSRRWSPAKLREEIAKYAHPRKRMEGSRSWLMPDGQWMNVGEHDNALPPDMPDAIVWGYDQMHAAGFVRVAYLPAIDTLHAEFHAQRLTPAQRRELNNTAIERKATLELTPQKPGILAASDRRQPLQRISTAEREAIHEAYLTEAELIGGIAESDPLASHKVIHYWNTHGFTEIANGDYPEITRAFIDAVQRIPITALPGQTIYRYQGYPTAEARDAYLQNYQPGEVITIARPVNAFTNWPTMGKELAESFGGDHQIEFVIESPKAVRDLASIFDDKNPGDEVFYPQGSQFTIKSISSPQAGTNWLGKPSEGSQVTVTLQETAIPRLSNALFASDRFYSQLQRTVEAKMPNRADAKTLRGLLENPQNRIKAEELKWSGLLAWADSQPQPLTKPQVLDYLATEGSVRFDETRLGGPRENAEQLSLHDQFSALTDQMVDLRRQTEEGLLTEAQAAAEYRRISDERDTLQPRYDAIRRKDLQLAARNTQWTLPGGDNHREVVVTWQQPDKLGLTVEYDHRRDEWDVINEEGFIRGTWRTKAEALDQIQAIREQKNLTPNDTSDTTHYGDRDALAWFRANDRDNGQGLLVEEFQSKWHKLGRDKGYQNDALMSQSARDEFDAVSSIDRRERTPEQETRYQELSRQWDNYRANGGKGVPDAPYRSAWPLMLFKRALADAVAEGKQWIGWTTGDTQADRYDLSKRIDAINVRNDKEGTFEVTATQDGKRIIHERDLPADKLAETIGKELAAKAIDRLQQGGIDAAEKNRYEKDWQKLSAAREKLLQAEREQFGSNMFLVRPGQNTDWEVYTPESENRRENVISRGHSSERRAWLGVPDYMSGFYRGKPGAIQEALTQYQTSYNILWRDHENNEITPDATTEWATFTGLELKVGGEGMRKFYDDILVKEFGKYVKPWGGKVTQSEVAGTTPKDAAAVFEIPEEEQNRVMAEADAAIRAENPGLDDESDDFQLALQERADDLAQEWARKNRAQSDTTPIWRIDITPAMRESVAAGQALFAADKVRDLADDTANAAYAAGDRSYFAYLQRMKKLLVMEKGFDAFKPYMRGSWTTIADKHGLPEPTRASAEADYFRLARQRPALTVSESPRPKVFPSKADLEWQMGLSDNATPDPYEVPAGRRTISPSPAQPSPPLPVSGAAVSQPSSDLGLDVESHVLDKKKDGIQNYGATLEQRQQALDEIYGPFAPGIQVRNTKTQSGTTVPHIMRGRGVMLDIGGQPHVATRQVALPSVGTGDAPGVRFLPLEGDKSNWTGHINSAVAKAFPKLDEETDLYLEPYGGGLVYLQNLDFLRRTSKPVLISVSKEFEPARWAIYSALARNDQQVIQDLQAILKDPTRKPATAEGEHFVFKLWGSDAKDSDSARAKEAFEQLPNLAALLQKPNVKLMPWRDAETFRAAIDRASAGKRVTLLEDSNYADLFGEDTADQYAAQDDHPELPGIGQEKSEFIGKNPDKLLAQKLPVYRAVLGAGGTIIATNNMNPTLLGGLLAEFGDAGHWLGYAHRTRPVPDGWMRHPDGKGVLWSTERPEYLAILRKGVVTTTPKYGTDTSNALDYRPGPRRAAEDLRRAAEARREPSPYTGGSRDAAESSLRRAQAAASPRPADPRGPAPRPAPPKDARPSSLERTMAPLPPGAKATPLDSAQWDAEQREQRRLAEQADNPEDSFDDELGRAADEALGPDFDEDGTPLPASDKSTPESVAPTLDLRYTTPDGQDPESTRRNPLESDQGPGPGTDGSGPLRLPAQASDMLAWAKENGWLIDTEDLAQRVGLMQEVTPGDEHDVWFDELTQRATKLTKDLNGTPAFVAGSPAAYLTNLRVQNAQFGTGFAFEGIVDDNGTPRFVISQPWITGTPATQQAKEAYFKAKGFDPAAQDTFYSIGQDLLVTDARNVNVYQRADGTVQPIDLQVRAVAPRQSEMWENRVAAYGLSSSDRTKPLPASERIAQAAQKTNTSPSEAQIEAENYETGKVTVQGLRLSIENPRGSVRRGTDANGKAWEITMPHHYGRILGTTGADKDHVDFFLGPDPTSPMAFVVNQKKPGNGHFDEHKIMLGFTHPGTAARGYLDSYSPGWRGYQSIVPMTLPQLKHWLEHGKMGEAVTKAPNIPLASTNKSPQSSAMASTPGAAQSNEPSPGGLSVAEATPQQMIEILLQRIEVVRDEIENQGFTVGLRGLQDRNQNPIDAKIGDVLPESFEWDDEEPTNNSLGGTAVFNLDEYESDDVEDVVRTAVAYFNGGRLNLGPPFKNGRYQDVIFAIVGGLDRGNKGMPERFAAVFQEATVFDVIRFPKENLSLTSPRAPSGTSPSLPLSASPRLLEQASRASFNHLDRWFTGALARQAKRVTSSDPVTAATQAAAAWWNQDTPGVSTLRSLKELAQRELLPETVLPREIMAAMREMQIKQSMGQQKALDVGRALSDKPKFSDLHYPPEFVENPMHREAMFSAMEQGKVDTLPPALQKMAQQLRAMLVEAGREAVRQGRMNPDTFEGLRTNFMPRFTKEEAQASAGDFAKRFKLGVKDILAQRSTAFHITDTSRKDKTGLPQIVSHARGKWRFDSQQARDAYYEDLINRQTLDGELAKNDMHWMNRGDARALRSITPEMLKAPATMTKEQRDVVARVQRQLRNQFKREDPYEPKDLVKDPVYAVMRYLAQMTHDNAVAEFFNVIDQNPDWTSSTEMKGFTQIPDNDRFGALAGKYVRKDIADQVMELAHTPAQVIQLYDTLLRLWKTGKTVLNPATHARNIIGNLPFAQFAGNNALNPANWTHYAHALRTLRQGGDEYRQLYETGVLGADYASTELRAALENIVPVVQEDDSTNPIRHLIALGNRAAQWGKAHSLANVATLGSVGATAGFIAAGPLGALAGAGIAAAANPIYRGALWAYRLEDDLFKAAAFFKARSMGMTLEQAAQHVRDWFPYYDKPTSTTLKFAGRTTMPFLSFFRESARIGAKAATERPLSLAATLAIPTIITALSQAALGLDDEDMEDVKSGMRGKGAKLLGMTPLAGVPIFSMLIPWRTSSGQLQQIDLSSTHPMADFLANRVENWNNDPWWQAWSRSALANPMLGALYTAATGRDPFGDRTLWDSSYTPDEKAKAILGHAWKTAVPPLAPGGTNWTMIDQSTRRQANKTLALRSPAQAVARGVAGIDVRTADPDIYGLADAFRKRRGLPVTEGNTAYPTDAAGRARKQLFEELVQPQPDPKALAKHLQALNDLGKPVRTVSDVLDILDYRRPDGVINPKELRAPFRASLAPEARRVLDTALREFQRARAATPGAFAKARQALKPTTRAPITEP